MPSRRSPRVRSWYSARAFSTFRMRFSIRTPVWIRSTWSLGFLINDRFTCTYVPEYVGTVNGGVLYVGPRRKVPRRGYRKSPIVCAFTCWRLVILCDDGGTSA